MPKIKSPSELEKLRKEIVSKRDEKKPCIAVCGGTGCRALGNQDIIRALEKELEKRSLKAKVDIMETGCPGLCEKGPIVVIRPEGILYTEVTPDDAAEIIAQTLTGKKIIERLLYTDPATGKKIAKEAEIPFYKNQMRLLIADNGRINPKSIEDYLAIGGYAALAKTLASKSRDEIIAEITKSGLRGRSGSGFPAGRKWEAGQKAHGDIKYVICNCHEGDPGAFADRRVMEGNPHNTIEGMIIGGYAIGASEGIIFVGDEFPLTVENIETAIEQAAEYGLLGKNILGSGFDFTIRVSIDAGDYVCGESTALTAAIEGRVGEPYKKYDHATESGLWGKPTVLNNLQTWANVPLIINRGAEWYAGIGTAASKGTRVFSLVGAVKNSGLVEAPMGMTLRQIIYDIGGGIRDDNKFKAVLLGGPLGAFLPESLLDTPVDFDEINKTGGSVGPSLIVMDDRTCIVDMIKYFLTFLSDESCGKCTPCREGVRQMLKIIDNISEGRGKEGDIELLETIYDMQRAAALCVLGQTASNPLRSVIKYFSDELEAHIKEKCCAAGVCKMPAPAAH